MKTYRINLYKNGSRFVQEVFFVSAENESQAQEQALRMVNMSEYDVAYVELNK